MEKDWHPVFQDDPSLYYIHYLNDTYFWYPSLVEIPKSKVSADIIGKENYPTKKSTKSHER